MSEYQRPQAESNTLVNQETFRHEIDDLKARIEELEADAGLLDDSDEPEYCIRGREVELIAITERDGIGIFSDPNGGWWLSARALYDADDALFVSDPGVLFDAYLDVKQWEA